MKRAALVVAMSILPVLGAVPAQSQNTSPEKTVVATVDGEEITASEVQMFYLSLPERYQQVPIGDIFQQVVERLVDQKLIANAARKEGIADRPQVKRQVNMMTEGLLQETYLQERIGPEITGEKLRAAYKERIAIEPPREEVHARHILLKTEEKAKEVIAELGKNDDFAAMARKHSTGPTGPQGGDLGFFAKDSMVPEFAEAAFAMKAGETSTQPVQTQFGWHVIRVEERRTASPRSFEEMEGELREEVGRNVYRGIISGLRENADVTFPGIK